MATTRQTNPKKTIITIPGSAGTPKLIAGTKFARYIEIQECPPGGGVATTYTGGNYAPQGMNYTLPDDGFSAQNPLLPGAILALGSNDWKRDRGYGVPPITDPAGNTIAGTPFGKFLSATVTTTQVELREWS